MKRERSAKRRRTTLTQKQTQPIIDQSRVQVTFQADNEGTGPVIYWMSRDQRTNDNWALLYAQHIAIQRKLPLIVVFALVDTFLGATIRQYTFMIEGLKQVEDRLRNMGIGFELLNVEEGLSPAKRVARFLQSSDACIVISDSSPLRISRSWKEELSTMLETTSFYEVDAHNVVPVWIASDKIEYAARTIRRKIESQFSRYLTDFPKLQLHPVALKSESLQTDWDEVYNRIRCDMSVPAVDWIIPGEQAALENLQDFLKNRISVYASQRNDPCKQALSNISPWLHFGQISAQRCAFEAKKLQTKYPDSVKAFVEELVVRKELAENYCYYNRTGYDRLDGLYPQYDNNSWAQKSLKLHRDDPRQYIYNLQQLEESKTHDDLWNAAQSQMTIMGKMHGFLRMYWAKKILEWTESPEQALEYAIYLNDRYSIDGRDPNGYVGIAWSIAGVHDQGWRERPIFGKIRYMNLKGCERKFDVVKFIRIIKKLTK